MGSLALWSCQKEESQNTLDTPFLNTTNQSSISLEEAKKYFEQVQTVIPTSNLSGDDEVLTPSCVTPNWYLATKSYYKTNREIIVVPLYDEFEIEDCPQGIVNLIFFKDKDNRVVQRFQFFLPENDYAKAHPSALDIKTFTGHTFLVNENGDVGYSNLIKNGKIFKAFDMKSDVSQINIAKTRGDLWISGDPCYDFRNHHIKHFRSRKQPKKGSYESDESNGFSAGLSWADFDDNYGNGNENGGGLGFKNYFDGGILGLKNVKKAYSDECGKDSEDYIVLLWHSAEHSTCHPDRREGTEDFFT